MTSTCAAGAGFVLRAGVPGDLPVLLRVLRAAVRAMEAQGIHQWDETYPARSDLEGDLAAGTLHVAARAGRPLAFVALDRSQPAAYAPVPWCFPEPALVVHRLTVDPAVQGAGLARRLMARAEIAARRTGCRSIRLDAFTDHPRALRLYEGLGYRRAGTVELRMGPFHVYERPVSSRVRGAGSMRRRDSHP